VQEDLSSKSIGAGINLGVIGVGHLGRHHARIAAESPASLVGIFDVDQMRARSVASGLGTTSYEKVDDLVQDCDAVIVATPAVTHHSVALTVLDAGCHCLVEKPLATDFKLASELVSRADSRNLILAVGHSERFNPAMEFADSFVEHPLYLECTRLAPFAGRGVDVDVVQDMMVHDLEIALYWMTDYPTTLAAVGVPVITSKVDMANVRLEFADGAVANLTASRASPVVMRTLRVFQRGGYVSVDLAACKVRMVKQTTAGMDIEERTLDGPEPLRAELEDFLDSVVTGKPPRVSGAMGAEALALARELVDLMGERLQRISHT
jgi:predicted dehydrogenase